MRLLFLSFNIGGVGVLSATDTHPEEMTCLANPIFMAIDWDLPKPLFHSRYITSTFFFK